MTIKFKLLTSGLIAGLLLSGCASLYPERDSYPDKRYPTSDRTSSQYPSGVFSSNDKQMIRDYYQGQGRNKPKKAKKLPPGLQKKYARTGQLPPGWQMKMQRGEVISQDIYRHGRDIPYELRRRLPIGPVGSKILEIEGKIFRVMENSREILDILDI